MLKMRRSQRFALMEIGLHTPDAVRRYLQRNAMGFVSQNGKWKINLMYRKENIQTRRDLATFHGAIKNSLAARFFRASIKFATFQPITASTMDKRLIQSVQNFKELYHKTSSSYKAKKPKENIWTRFESNWILMVNGKTVDISVLKNVGTQQHFLHVFGSQLLKGRWKNLRDTQLKRGDKGRSGDTTIKKGVEMQKHFGVHCTTY